MKGLLNKCKTATKVFSQPLIYEGDFNKYKMVTFWSSKALIYER